MQKIIVNHQPALSISVEPIIDFDANTEKRMKADLDKVIGQLSWKGQLGVMEFIQARCQGVTQDRQMVVLSRALVIAQQLLIEEQKQ